MLPDLHLRRPTVIGGAKPAAFPKVIQEGLAVDNLLAAKEARTIQRESPPVRLDTAPDVRTKRRMRCLQPARLGFVSLWGLPIPTAAYYANWARRDGTETEIIWGTRVHRSRFVGAELHVGTSFCILEEARPS